jgi:hypothetical protein
MGFSRWPVTGTSTEAGRRQALQRVSDQLGGHYWECMVPEFGLDGHRYAFKQVSESQQLSRLCELLVLLVHISGPKEI